MSVEERDRGYSLGLFWGRGRPRPGARGPWTYIVLKLFVDMEAEVRWDEVMWIIRETGDNRIQHFRPSV